MDEDEDDTEEEDSNGVSDRTPSDCELYYKHCYSQYSHMTALG